MRMAAAALFLSLVMTSCYGSDAPADREVGELNRGTALVETDDESALFYVIVAETEEQRAAAFERTASLDDDEGMAFLYFEPTTEEFEMQGRLALSVAFFDAEGEVVDVAELQACAGSDETCATHDPRGPYQGALAVGAGVFDRIGVGEGAAIEIVPGSE